MKRFAILSLMIGLGAVATSLSAAPAGLVQSRENFVIERESAQLGVRPNVLADVATGDVVATKLASATVRTENMGSVVVSPASRVSFLTDSMVTVLSGSVVSYVPAGQTGAVRASDLTVSPLAAGKANDGHIAFVEQMADGRVVVEAVRDSFSVAADGSETRLATMTQGDKLIFTPTPAGWMIEDAVQGSPADVRLVQDQSDSAAEAVPQEEEDEEDRRRAWWFWPAVIGGGALVAGGGGYLVYQATNGDDDNDNDNGGDGGGDGGGGFPGGGGDDGFSPILPPGVRPDTDEPDEDKNDWLYYYGFFGNTTSVSVLR